MFEWDPNNLRKIQTHRITRDEAEQALSNDPILVYAQEVQGEIRFVYYGESDEGRLLGVIVTERGDKLRVITAYDLDGSQRREYLQLREPRDMKKQTREMPKFKNESQEADWWASRAGRSYVKQKAAEAGTKGIKPRGSNLVNRLSQRRSIQIAIRLPSADLDRARQIAQRKGIGYQTLVKMLVHEGLAREARRG